MEQAGIFFWVSCGHLELDANPQTVTVVYIIPCWIYFRSEFSISIVSIVFEIRLLHLSSKSWETQKQQSADKAKNLKMSS